MDGSDMSVAPSSTVTENKSQRRLRLKAELEILRDLVARLEARSRDLLAVAEPTSSHDSRNNMGSDAVHGQSREQQQGASGRSRHSREGSHSRQNSDTGADMGNDIMEHELDSNAGADIFTKERRAVGARMSVAVNDFEKEGSHHGDTQLIKRRKIAASQWEGREGVEGDLAYEGSGTPVWRLNSGQSRAEVPTRDGQELGMKRRLTDLAADGKVPTAIPVSIWQICVDILEELMADSESWAFSRPVKDMWPDLGEYFDVIKEPRDLGTVRANLVGREYSHPKEYARDVRLTFNNALKYNEKTSEYFLSARKLKARFDSKYRTVERRLQQTAIQASRPVALPVLDRRYAVSEQVNGSQRLGAHEVGGSHEANGTGHILVSSPLVADVEAPSMPRPAVEDSPRLKPIHQEFRSVNYSGKVDSGKTARLPKPSKKVARDRSLPAGDPKAGAVVDPRLGRAKSAKAYGGPRPLTNKEKLKLTELVQDLPADRQNMIYQMVSSKISANSEGPQQETAEFDMNSIDDMTMFEVFRVTMNWQKSKSKVLGSTKAARGSKGKDDGGNAQPPKAKQSYQKSKSVVIDVGHKAGAEEEDVDIMNDSPTPHRGGGEENGELKTNTDAGGNESPRHSSSGSSSNDSSSSSSSGSDSSSSGSDSDADSGVKD